MMKFLKKVKNFCKKLFIKKKFLIKKIFFLLTSLAFVYLFYFFKLNVACASDDFSSLFNRDIRAPFRRNLTEEEIDFGFMLVNVFREKYPKHLVLQAVAFNKNFLKVYIKVFDKNF